MGPYLLMPPTIECRLGNAKTLSEFDLRLPQRFGKAMKLDYIIWGIHTFILYIFSILSIIKYIKYINNA